MTAQARELLLFDGKPNVLETWPLEAYLDFHGIDGRGLAESSSTHLYRGYLGVWEIADGGLYLIGLFGPDDETIPASAVAPGWSFPVRADWFNGKIDIERGERLMGWHQGSGGFSTWRLRLYLECGRVLKGRRFDQRKRLRRLYAPDMADYGSFWLHLIQLQAGSLSASWGFTEAGFQALGRAFEGVRRWSSSDDGDVDEYASELIAQCVRPGAPAQLQRPTSTGSDEASSAAPEAVNKASTTLRKAAGLMPM